MDKQGGIDFDGGLIIPFTPTDFADYESIETVTVEVEWGMAGAWRYEAPNYVADDRILGFPYDFKVKLIVK